jgi:MFS transporter, DHA2 family, multidrug resistance protein
LPEGAGQGLNYLPEMGHASPQGLALVYGLVRRQAMMLAFNDIYRTISIALIPLIPLYLLLPRSTSGPGAAASH